MPAMPSCRVFLILLFGLLAGASDTRAESPVEKARDLFTRWSEKAGAFDASVADLYAADAKIENKRIYPEGTSRVTTVTGSNYQRMLRMAMPLAKVRGDTSTYSDVKYAEEGKNVRMTATRFSNLKKYSSPITLVVGPGPADAWVILEESSESKP